MKKDFPAKVRNQLKEHYNGLCQHCGRKGDHIHHVKPAGRGGYGVFENGLLVCFKCHMQIHANNTLLDYYIQKHARLYGDQFYKKGAAE